MSPGPASQSTPDEQSIRVEPASGPSYEVRVGSGVARGFASCAQRVLGTKPGRVFAVIDDGVPESWSRAVLDSFTSAGYTIHTHSMHPTERTKSLETLGYLLGVIAASGLERKEPVLAIGGGIVGDVAGFAASAYRRGVPVIQCPTTLLAMVDASVGGKTGVNLTIGGGESGGKPDLLKNMAGAFHQPRAVLADVSALASLSDRHMRSGLAECIKHGLIAGDWDDPDLAEWLTAAIPAILKRDTTALIECVARNAAVKARVVAADEKEQSDTGGRALLNLGHTYAHAIETIATLSPTGDPADAPLHHGEAVGLGLVAASACAAAMGLVDQAHTVRTKSMVQSCGLPTAVAGMPDDNALLARMQLDKKTAGGVLRLTLPTGPATAKLVTDPPRPAVLAGWVEIRSFT